MRPKSQGGWGLKHVFNFGKVVLAKSLWNFSTKDSLWRSILVEKYIAHDSEMDWIRRIWKSIQNMSNQWKALTLAFPTIGKFLAWKVGSGALVRVRMDAITGCGENVFLPEDLVQYL